MVFHKWLTFPLVALSLSRVCVAQEISPTLPPEVAKAAVTAFPEYDTGTTFDTILQSGTNFPDPIVITRSYDANAKAGVVNPPLYPSHHMKSLVMRSDFVGTGVPLKRWTLPLKENSFAVSVYLVHVTDVAVPGKEGIGSGSDIYIARPGGMVAYHGHNFRTIDPDFELFHLNEQYIFFASQIAPGLYKVDAPRTLKIEGTQVGETSKQHPLGMFYSSRTPDSIMNEARDAWKEEARSKGDKQ
jgi:hypothetical protein